MAVLVLWGLGFLLLPAYIMILASDCAARHEISQAFDKLGDAPQEGPKHGIAQLFTKFGSRLSRLTSKTHKNA
jgi:hypothetical protein